MRQAVPALALMALCSTALAQEHAVEAEADGPARNYGNLRAGAATSGSRPVLCMELAPLAFLSVEACGTGSGFLHKDPEPELAHFRAKAPLGSWRSPLGWIQARAALGFAELQVGEDTAGFDFAGSGGGQSTAGPEAGLSLRSIMPIYEGFDFLMELDAAAAWLPHAPELVEPGPTVLPSASFTVGVGF